MNARGYESWFLSARDPRAPRALWIRHTRQRGRTGPPTSALWCAVAGLGPRPAMVKQVFPSFPAGTEAGPRQFRGSAILAGQAASWELSISGGEPPLHPLRPALLERAPLPRTKLTASVPDGLVSGTLTVGGLPVPVSGWRATVGHNWGSEHADTWVWLHAADFAAAPRAWLELVLARVRVAGARSPWLAMGALGLGGERIPLGGLGRLPRASAQPGRLVARIPSPGGRLLLAVTAPGQDAVAVPYTDPAGGGRAVRHALLATVELTLARRGQPELTLTSSRGAYEFGTSGGLPGIALAPLPAG